MGAWGWRVSWQEGAPAAHLRLPETCRQERVTAVALRPDLPHSIAVPLGGTDPVGVLVLWSAYRAFTRDDERLLRGVAPLLALALRRG